jgi:predicted DCC family thiol-disulfide oxidoreductase YuxK
MKPTMVYDGGCPLCRREVAHYRRLDRADRVRWIAITREPEALASHGIGYAAAMERLHGYPHTDKMVSQ